MRSQLLLILLIVVFTPILALSQDKTKPNSLKLEGGLGAGMAGDGGGINTRLAVGFISHKWGGMVRMTVQKGGSGKRYSGFDPFGLNEWFYDRAILVSRVISKNNEKSNIIASAGIGSFYGDKFNESKTSTRQTNKTFGFAYEIGISTTRHFVGFSTHLFGNINNETIYIGLVFSINFSAKW